jgi:hypothetical protein
VTDAAGVELSRGRQVLLEKGILLESTVSFNAWSYGITEFADAASIWRSANFNTFNANATELPDLVKSLQPYGIQWGRWYALDQPNSKYVWNLGSPHMNNFVTFQYGDELFDTLTQPRLDDMKSTYAEWRRLYPKVLAYTNAQYEYPATVADISRYMQHTKPDMLSFDCYPSYDFAPEWRTRWYSTMQKYRTAAQLGNDGAGQQPIPWGQYLRLYRPDYRPIHDLPSESYVRLAQFATWAFGGLQTNAFLYNDPTGGDAMPAMFSSMGESSPTPVFPYVAESNRQSRNLSPALVRLVSTGIYLKPGSGTTTADTDLTPWSARAGATAGYADYLTNIQPKVSQGGPNDPGYSDILVGYFKPLQADNAGATFADGLHFMIVNGDAGVPFLPTDPAADPAPASAAAQWYRLTFDFSGSDFDSLARLSRDTGQVELVTLTHSSGSTYYLDLNLPGGTGDLFAFWDSSDPLPTIPEPGTLALLGIAGLGLLVYTLRKRCR